MIFKLPIIETIKDSWSKVAGAKGTLWVALILFFFFESFPKVFRKFAPFESYYVPAGHIISITCFVFSLFMALSIIYLSIKRAMNEPIQFKMIRKVFDIGLFFRAIGLIILKLLILSPAFFLLGLANSLHQGAPSNIAYDSGLAAADLIRAVIYVLALIIGIYFSIRVSLAAQILVFEKAGAVTSIKNSFAATKSNVFRIFSIHLFNILLLVITSIPLGIGLIWYLPYSCINNSVMYRKLVAERK